MVLTISLLGAVADYFLAEINLDLRLKCCSSSADRTETYLNSEHSLEALSSTRMNSTLYPSDLMSAPHPVRVFNSELALVQV